MPFSPHRAEPEPLVDLTNTPEVLRCSKPTRTYAGTTASSCSSNPGYVRGECHAVIKYVLLYATFEIV